jgi:hypothetical protein
MTSVASISSRYNCCTARIERWITRRKNLLSERIVDRSQSNEHLRHGNYQFAIMGKYSYFLYLVMYQSHLSFFVGMPVVIDY